MLATVTLLEGPNPFAPFAAVMVQAECPAQVLPADHADAYLKEFLPPLLRPHVTTLRDGRFETVVAAIATSLHDCFGANELPVHVERLGEGRCRILLGYLDPNATALAMRTALDLAAALFAQLGGQGVDTMGLSTRVDRTVEQMLQRHPDPIARSLIRAARRRGIPVCPVAPGSRAWLFGHGARGIQFFEAANEFDSMIGARIARHKFRSNQLVSRMGFPAVKHSIAADPQAAMRVAREIGYPLVVKPVASGKGAGVTAYITDDLTLAGAFAEADRISPGDVLVERYVAGEDHRIVVIGGKFAWAVCRSPASVVGDGVHSVAELMAIENARRAESPSADIGPGRLEFDDAMQRVLRSQGLRIDDRPAEGARVALRTIANIARGGTLSDCSASVHPDVRDMAEAIARGFHLDVMGLDFMTPDITRSWRDVACAVLEVNAMPGFSSDGRAEIILDSKFPGGGTGRIPTVVLVDAPNAAFDDAVAALELSGCCVGRTDSAETQLGGRPRMTASPPVTLGTRVTALILDPGCDALVIAVTSGEIEQHGFPVARCDVALLGADAATPAPTQRLIVACADATFRVHGTLGSDSLGAIAAARESKANR